VTGSDDEPIELVVTEEEAGERLDRVLSARDLGWSRTTVQRWIEAGRVEVDGAAVSRRTPVQAGASVVIRPLPPPPSTAEPEDIPLAIIHEDEDLLVLDKAAGLVVHPAPGHPGGTLVNALLHHAQLADAPLGDGLLGDGSLEGDGATERPGIVHRLDKDTSGVMVVAKTAVAREGLIALFKEHDVERVYRAIALGGPPERATWETTMGRHPRDRKRFTSRTTRGKRAVTHLRCLERLHGAALVECRLETGRTHQIRVHLSDHGFPILADPVYGRRSRDPRVLAAAEAIGRQALHAGVLAFVHPVGGVPMRFETPPPADFEAALALLRG